METLPVLTKLSQQNTFTLDQTIIKIVNDPVQDRYTSGVNSRNNKLSLEWVALTSAELTTLLAFWTTHGKSKAWLYTATELQATPLKYVFSEGFMINNTGCNTYSVSTMAMQVFD